jgi:hypothetical protein
VQHGGRLLDLLGDHPAGDLAPVSSANTVGHNEDTTLRIGKVVVLVIGADIPYIT